MQWLGSGLGSRPEISFSSIPREHNTYLLYTDTKEVTVVPVTK
jgi:hypothetical protein